jgi:hypothetical protein
LAVYVKKNNKLADWRDTEPPYQLGRLHFTQGDMQKDPDGWIDVKHAYPINYEMVQILIEEKRPINGWWNGSQWEGFRLEIGDKVLCWRDKCH